MKDESPEQFALRGTRYHFTMFARNGRWGTCVDCPRTVEHDIFPEFCKQTDRYDHRLTLESLVELYERHLQRGRELAAPLSAAGNEEKP